MKIMKMEQIDAHVEKYLKTTAKAKPFNMCATYAAVKPVLVFVKGMLFFKPKWQTVIQNLINALDGVCAVELKKK